LTWDSAQSAARGFWRNTDVPTSTVSSSRGRTASGPTVGIQPDDAATESDQRRLTLRRPKHPRNHAFSSGGGVRKRSRGVICGQWSGPSSARQREAPRLLCQTLATATTDRGRSAITIRWPPVPSLAGVARKSW
jgi:hypothetical protein